MRDKHSRHLKGFRVPRAGAGEMSALRWEVKKENPKTKKQKQVGRCNTEELRFRYHRKISAEACKSGGGAGWCGCGEIVPLGPG